MKDDRVLLQHILDCLARVSTYTRDGEAAFRGDEKTQDAVLRNIEVIGEAVKALSTAFKQAHPAIPWKQVAGMRDILIHQYWGVDLATVWSAVAKDLPALDAYINGLLASA